MKSRDLDSDRGAELRERVWELHACIADRFYLNRRETALDGRRFNAALLFGVMTALARGKALIVGEPGLGKTTSAEWICALFYRMPLAVVWRATVAGHPEQTEEKIVGRPDLGRLNRGEEAVRWSYFSLLPTKIVDEINRLPETKQNLILDGVDRGKWEYLNDAVVNDTYVLFATANYADQGTHSLVAPLLDRFDVMVESKHPGANLAFRIGAAEADGDLLRAPEIEAAFHDLLGRRLPHGERLAGVESLCGRFGERLNRRLGVRTLSLREMDAVHRLCGRVPFDTDANAFLRLVISELSFCGPFGQKRFEETCQEGCHFSEYLCHDIRSCVSNRFSTSVQRYARVLAWLLGERHVTVALVKAVAPHALAHRALWHDRALARRDGETRDDPMAIHMAKRAVGRMHRRYLEQSGTIREALTAAFRIAAGEKAAPVRGDHPIYRDILRDLGIPDEEPPLEGSPRDERS